MEKDLRAAGAAAARVPRRPSTREDTARSALRIGARPRLLVSIADTGEVAAALAGGAEILDVKDPRKGSLGAADPRVVACARREAPEGLPVTAALGDGPWGARDAAEVVRLAGRLAAAGAALLKVGAAGLRPEDAASRVERLVRRVRDVASGRAPAVVLVGFADDRESDPIAGEWLPRAAARAGCAGAMLDTIEKRRSLLELRSPAELRRWVARVHAQGLLCGLAGSLRLEDLAAADATGADVVGLRGAVCDGGRDGRISVERVAAARRALESVPLRRSPAATWT